MLTDCLLTVFEERIFSQNKSKLLQLIPLYVIGHANKALINKVPGKSTHLSELAVGACNTFAQLILSFLVRTAFPEETLLMSSTDSSSA